MRGRGRFTPAPGNGDRGHRATRVGLVRPDGGIVAQSGGISLRSKPLTGMYILNFGSSIAGKLILASTAFASDTDFRGGVIAGPCGGGAEGAPCTDGNDVNHVIVITLAPTNTTRQDHSFYVGVIG